MRLMKRFEAMLLAACILLCPCMAAGEGDPLLSVDDLMQLEESYKAFLSELEALVVERGLLSENERQAWRDAQLGDFFQNGGYGSILANYTPGVLSYVRAEETTITLRAPLSGGQTLEVLTMRRYTPRDSSLSGLMLTLTLYGADGSPQDVKYAFSATSGVFLKWDQRTGAYVSVGATASSEGETVVWSDQTPSEGAKNPVITFALTDALTEEAIPGAMLALTVDGDGYQVTDGALSALPAADQ
ncbi:MAG: hypothetical protein IKU34_09180 [Clostridia bacterium]|nr:hypothetical protein [Clostridia bacterium]